MSEIAIRVENLSKLYPELSARAGRNGAGTLAPARSAGESTLLKILSRITEPTSGCTICALSEFAVFLLTPERRPTPDKREPATTMLQTREPIVDIGKLIIASPDIRHNRPRISRGVNVITAQDVGRNWTKWNGLIVLQ